MMEHTKVPFLGVDFRKCKKVGEGLFSTVYLISPRRVAKVYDRSPCYKGLKFVLDEKQSASQFYRGLPVLHIVKVKLRGVLRVAAIKRYLPRKVSDWTALQQKALGTASGASDCIDFWAPQYRADSRGTVYRVDTQLDVWESKSND